MGTQLQSVEEPEIATWKQRNWKEGSWKQKIDEIGPELAARVEENDESDRFVHESYNKLRELGFFSAQVPVELGGGGVSHREMCDLLRQLSRYCSSTGLATSMHQHLVAAAVWNHRHGNPGQKLLEKVADDELVLVSTGAKDWLESSGSMERVEGGFRVSAFKPFASGSPAGDLAITSAPYEDPEHGWQVLHFPVPLDAEGVSSKGDWKAMGMRATGSHTLVLDKVFVPDEAIGLRRPRGDFHPAWNVILTVAMPLISAAYVGLAEAAAELAREAARKHATNPRDPVDPVVALLIGEMESSLATAQIALDSMIDLAQDGEFEPTAERSSAVLVRKTIAVRAVAATTEKALEAMGGAGFLRSKGLERRVRDAQAGNFHPLPEKRQQLFTGRLALGLDPIGN